jgi:hypothetical protein
VRTVRERDERKEDTMAVRDDAAEDIALLRELLTQRLAEHQIKIAAIRTLLEAINSVQTVIRALPDTEVGSDALKRAITELRAIVRDLTEPEMKP